MLLNSSFKRVCLKHEQLIWGERDDGLMLHGKTLVSGFSTKPNLSNSNDFEMRTMYITAGSFKAAVITI